MEELHRIHKEVPFGYWVVWVEPVFKALRRKWREVLADNQKPSTQWRLLRWG